MILILLALAKATDDPARPQQQNGCLAGIGDSAFISVNFEYKPESRRNVLSVTQFGPGFSRQD